MTSPLQTAATQGNLCGLAFESPNFFSQKFAQAGFTFLVHKTEPEKLVSILKMGAQVTGEKVPIPPTGVGRGANIPNKTFMDLTKHLVAPAAEPPGYYSFGWASQTVDGETVTIATDLDGYILVFSLQALNHLKFHASSHGHIRYGRYDPTTDLHFENFEFANTYFERKSFGEVVFYEDVPVTYLEAVWVHPEKRNLILEALHREGVSKINGRTIESIVVSPST